MSNPAVQYRPFLPVYLLRLLVLSPLLLALLSSCKSRKNTQATAEATNTGGCGLENKSAKTLMAEMKKGEFRFTWLAAHLDCNFKGDSSDQSFDVNLRMKRDSAIWLNITDPVIGISVARVLITVDSVKFVNKIASPNQCFQGDYAYISRLLNTELDFEMIQSILIGNSVSFYEEDEKLHGSINQQSCQYLLSTTRKRRTRKALEGTRSLNDPLQVLTLDPQSHKILHILFRDFESNRTFDADYSEFEATDSLTMARKTVYNISDGQKKAVLSVRYSRVNTQKELTFPFSIPDDCVPVQIKRKD